MPYRRANTGEHPGKEQSHDPYHRSPKHSPRVAGAQLNCRVQALIFSSAPVRYYPLASSSHSYTRRRRVPCSRRFAAGRAFSETAPAPSYYRHQPVHWLRFPVSAGVSSLRQSNYGSAAHVPSVNQPLLDDPEPDDRYAVTSAHGCYRAQYSGYRRKPSGPSLSVRSSSAPHRT